MRRQRSVSFYAETEDEYVEEYNRRKSISERRRSRPRIYGYNNDEKLENQKNNDFHNNKKFFQSYDDLELDQLGVNSTFQITTIDKEESEENEGGLIQKINNINLSFKQNNNKSFFSNLAPFTKNIIGSLGSKVKQKDEVMLDRTKSDGSEINEDMSDNIINNLKKDKKKFEENNNNEDNDDDYGNLLGTGCGTYHMRYLGLNNQNEDSNIIKRERNNSIIENVNENDNISFLDNININELNSNYNLFLGQNENNDNDYNNNYKINNFEQE